MPPRGIITTPAKPQMSAAEITAVLQKAGAIDTDSGSFNRMKVDATSFVTETDIFVYNQRTDEPAFIARVMAPPEQYQALWWTRAMAEYGGRVEDLPDKDGDNVGFMCKSYYDRPGQERKFSETGASCENCAFKPFAETPPGFNQSCSWKGDLKLQLIPESGQLTGDEPIYTLTLTQTGMVEFRGTRKEKVKGSATDANFMHRLATLAVSKADEWSVDPEAAIMLALTSLHQGGVAAEARIFRQTSTNGSFSWSIPSFNPIHVEHPELDASPQLGDGAAEATPVSAI